MTNTQTAISEAVSNKPKGYKARFCGTWLNGRKSPGEARSLQHLEYAKKSLTSLLIEYPDISITFFGNFAQIDHRHARILACLIYKNWVFLEKNIMGENYNYVIPNSRRYYILSTLDKLLNEPINNHKDFV